MGVEKIAAPTTAEPGTVVAVEKEGIIVATGNETALLLTELQPAGKNE